jgi:CDP-diacylglycerol---serine O-phosphatidyltransferase
MSLNLRSKYKHNFRLGKKFNLPRIPFRRGLQVIPNIFTLGNSFFGFCSIIFAAREAWVPAAFCIFLGALMDALDGQVARWVRSSSEFGLQLDSLSDAITFCLAPAFLIYCWQLKRLGIIGMVICGIFLAFGLLRLAKFNITHNEQAHSFIGVPTPFAACFIASFVLNVYALSFKSFFSLASLAFAMIVLSGLMVCAIRIPTFKHVKKGFYALATIVFVAFAIVFGFVKVLFSIFSAYMIFALSKYIFCKISQIIRYLKFRFQVHEVHDVLQESLIHK